jgi:hypothetical protein
MTLGCDTALSVDASMRQLVVCTVIIVAPCRVVPRVHLGSARTVHKGGRGLLIHGGHGPAGATRRTCIGLNGFITSTG